MGLFQWILRRVVRPDDDREAEVRKKLSIIWTPVAFGGILGATQLARYPVSVACFLLGMSTVLLFLFVFMLTTRRMPQSFLEIGMVICVVLVVIGDWGAAAGVGYVRIWPGAVLIMDVLLTLGSKHWVQFICLINTAVWLVVSTLEDSYRLGLYDIDGWSEQPIQVYEERTNCGKLPCATGLAGGMTKFIFYFACLFVDYSATRGFAEGQRREQERVGAMVVIAGRVARLLAAYKVAEAELIVAEDGGALPPDFRVAFELQLANLKSYRPYLPDSLMAHRDESSEIVPPSSPTAGRGAEGRGSTASAESALRAECPAGDTSVSGIWTGQSEPGTEAADGLADFMDHPRSPVVTHLRRLPQARKVALLARNSCGLLAAATQVDSATMGTWLASEVERFGDTVRALGGVTDLLSGDHLSASFGAVKVQGTAKVNAVHAATELAAVCRSSEGELGALATSTVVCSGRALCGDFGSTTAQRFMVIGGVSSFLVAVERAAAAWGTPTLLDSAVHADILHLWDCRLRKKALFPKLTPKPIGLWEIVEARGTGQGEEWMYELAEAKANPWNVYNEAVSRWCEVGAASARE
eukprot:TRINITY_DN13229_c1_g1_i1.p1 TRINITY_DN13229_c1_g1~~TRINITY_DN13229_c1_g1_i1.p1  ORF type:complete len:583 (+),score=108.07 TRINITY_DN13229_c1_g1_i1:100-1848(+)